MMRLMEIRLKKGVRTRNSISRRERGIPSEEYMLVPACDICTRCAYIAMVLDS